MIIWWQNIRLWMVPISFLTFSQRKKLASWFFSLSFFASWLFSLFLILFFAFSLLCYSCCYRGHCSLCWYPVLDYLSPPFSCFFPFFSLSSPFSAHLTIIFSIMAPLLFISFLPSLPRPETCAPDTFLPLTIVCIWRRSTCIQLVDDIICGGGAARGRPGGGVTDQTASSWSKQSSTWESARAFSPYLVFFSA